MQPGMSRVVLVSAWLGDRAAVAIARRYKPFEWVYVGENTLRMLSWRRRLGAERQVLLGRRTSERAREILRSYVSWIDGLGAGEYSNLFWWLSEVSERNIYCPSNPLLNLTYLSLWREFVSDERSGALLVVVESTALGETLALNGGRRAVSQFGFRGRRLLKRLAFPFRVGLAKARYLTGLGVRWGLGRCRRGLAPDLLFDPVRPSVLVHTWANASASPGGAFTENYFGALPEWLRLRGQRVVLVPWFFRRTSYWQYLAQVRRSPVPALVPLRILTLGDLVRATALPLFRSRLPRGRTFSWKDLDVSPLVREARRLSAASFRTSDALLHYFLARRLAAAGARVQRVLHIYESHIWEKALCIGMREFFPGTEVVGFQHNALSEFETNYYLAPEEAGAPSQPDRIVCLGPAWVKVLCDNGFDPGSLRAGAALRFTHLFEAERAAGVTVAKDGGPKTVLVTPGVDPQEGIDTVVKVLAALGSRQDLRVVIKTHPLSAMERLLERALIQSSWRGSLPEHFSLAGGRLSDWLPTADLLIYGGTTTGWEALVAGIPALFLGRDCGLSFDPVRVETGSKRSAFTVEELRRAVDVLLRGGAEARAQAKRASEEILKEWFGPVCEESLAQF